ncbi:MAG: helix-turn-helix transcriptional regulator [Clostridia bacterium]|nr:helix-turn-helix transcriptional regulator [Clostridia bacterium]
MEFKIHELTRVLSVSGIVNLHFFEFPENYATKDDKHPFAELIFVNTGSVYISSTSYTGPLEKGEMIIHKPNELHALRCPKKSCPSVVIIGFVCNSEKLGDFSHRPFALNEQEISKLAEVAKEGRNVFAPPYNKSVYNMKKKEKQPYGSEQILEILFESFLISLVRRYSPVQSAKEAVEEHSFAVGEVIRYLDENFLEKITIDNLAFLFRTNRSSLCREFKNATGKTIIEYINDKKLELAKEKIANSDKSFTQIAEDLHFESIHYFSRFFTQRTGLAPSEYRARSK